MKVDSKSNFFLCLEDAKLSTESLVWRALPSKGFVFSWLLFLYREFHSVSKFVIPSTWGGSCWICEVMFHLVKDWNIKVGKALRWIKRGPLGLSMVQVLKDSQSYYMLVHPQCVGGYLVENYAVIKELICLHQNAFKVSQSLHWDLVKIGKATGYPLCMKFTGRKWITFFENQRCCFF